MKINKENWKRNGAYGLFWLWHLIYTVLALAVFIPYLLMPMIEDVAKDLAPWHYLIYTSVIVLLPFVSMFLAATSFAKQPKNLMKYFYGFEMPLLLLLLIRIITLREAHAGMMWLMLNVSIALATWLVFLWWQNKQAITLPFKHNGWALSASTVLAMIGVYVGILLVLFAIPAAAGLVKALAEGIMSLLKHGIDWDDVMLLLHPLFYLGLIFFFFTASLFIALPIVMVRLYLGQFIQRFRVLLATAKATSAMVIVFSVVVVNVSAFVLLNQQKDMEILQGLDEKITQPAYEKELLSQSNTIRKSLLNAYIARYRYVSPTGTSGFINEIYRDAFETKPSTIQWPQTVFNALATPFLYDANAWQKDAAKKHYEYFFDTPIQKTERDAILNAIKYTWEMDGNEAGLLNAASHYVHLKTQDIQLKEQQGVVTVNVSQRLENKTYEAQEVVLHFSLPEDAVVTGLWLSDSPRTPQQYPFVVAPKGAAQAVYKAEVKRRIDPALLEKTGPYQYRMRIYPIPAKVKKTGKAEPLYMQFEYQTIVQKTGRWAVPKLLEKRNIFWDDDTQFSINGMSQPTQEPSVWLSEDGVTQHSFATRRTESNLRFNDPQTQTQIQAIPRQPTKEQALFKQLKQPLRILIDGSYSMTKHKAHLLRLLQQLHALGVPFNSYFCRQDCQALTHFSELDQQIFYGNSQTHDHLAASMKISSPNQPAAVLVLSDEGSYELAADNDITALNSPVPLWLVHITNTLPYAYDDKVLDLLYRSKGGVETSIMGVLMRMNQQGIKQAAGIDANANIVGVSNDYIWVEQASASAMDSTKHNSALANIIAAYRIKHLIRQMDMQQLDNLDAIHAIAKKHGIVSHYSSMLVLINDRQKEALKKAEQADDRFERENETGEQEPSTPSDLFSVSAVPEPEEWALLVIILAMLTMAMWRRRNKEGRI